MNPVNLQLTPAVIDAVNGELAYQMSLVDAGRADKIDYGVPGQLVTASVYTKRALEAWTDNPTDEQALHGLRKVCAIAARALILYGCPVREGFSKAVYPYWPPLAKGQPEDLISVLKLSVRAENCLESEGIETLDQLIRKTADNLLMIRMMGHTTVQEIREKLAEFGLKLASDKAE